MSVDRPGPGERYAIFCQNCQCHWASDVETPINTPCPFCGHVGWPNKRATCNWREVEEYGEWQSDCGDAFHIIDGTPNDNHMNYCCYCGKKLTQTPYEEHNDDTPET